MKYTYLFIEGFIAPSTAEGHLRAFVKCVVIVLFCDEMLFFCVGGGLFCVCTCVAPTTPEQ